MSKSGRRNRRSHRANAKLPAKARELSRSHLLEPNPKMLVWRRLFGMGKLIWALVGALATIVGLYSLWPRVSIEVGESVDPTNPFETRFVLQNQGLLPIHDIFYSHHWFDGQKINNQRIWHGAVFPEITAHELASGEKCSMRLSTPEMPKPNKKFIMELDIFFRPSFWPFIKNSYFQFYALPGSDKNLRWFRADTGHRWTGNFIPELNN